MRDFDKTHGPFYWSAVLSAGDVVCGCGSTEIESILPPRIADLPQCDPLCPDVTVLGEGRGQCRICGTVLKTLVAARSHVRKIHLSGGCIECVLCGGQAKNRQAFAMHLLRRHQLRGEKQALESYGRTAAAPSPAAVAPAVDVSCY